MDRRDFIRYGELAAGAVIAARVSPAEAQQAQEAVAAAAALATLGARQPIVAPGGQPAVVTPNGSTLPLRTVNGVKVGHLIAEPVDHEFAPGLPAECRGYNGSTPGSTIEAVEGDTLRLYVSNRLPEPTTVHWHGIILPNRMDGVVRRGPSVTSTWGACSRCSRCASNLMERTRPAGTSTRRARWRALRTRRACKPMAYDRHDRHVARPPRRLNGYRDGSTFSRHLSARRLRHWPGAAA